MEIVNESTKGKIRLETKKLKSGRCQVKFFIKDGSYEKYGYILAEPKTLLKEVVSKIDTKMRNGHFQNHSHLFALGTKQLNQDILIF